MPEQVLNQFRSDRKLREDCIAIYDAMGMDLNTAFRMFMERTRMVNGLPFPAVLPSNPFAKKSEDEFYASMNRGIEQAKQGYRDAEDAIEEIGSELDL